jgi:hypothetical protein
MRGNCWSGSGQTAQGAGAGDHPAHNVVGNPWQVYVRGRKPLFPPHQVVTARATRMALDNVLQWVQQDHLDNAQAHQRLQ